MNRLDVLYTCDENYAPYAGISMFSLFENNRDLDSVRVYLVAQGISDTNRERLVSLAESFSRELIIIDGEELTEKIKAMGIPAYRGSYSANFRLFFDVFVLPDTSRLLYLDCDTVIVSSLEPLVDMDMRGAAAGVVRDSLTAEYKELIGLTPDAAYFNSGMLLIDTAAWRAEQITERIFEHVKNVRARYCNPDQDLLNIALEGKTIILPPEYNFQPSHRAFSDKAYFGAYRHTNYYTHEELENARKNPKILHTYRFLGDFPWHEGNLHPDNEIFDKYMRSSLWSDYVKRPAGRGLIFTAEKLMYRFMPKSLFLKIFAAITFRSFKKQNKQILSETSK